MDRIPTDIRIDDPGDPRIAHFVGLRDRELARPAPTGEPGVFIAEGDVVAERAIRAGYRLRAVLVDATRTDPLYRRTSRVAMGEGYAFPWAWIARLPGGLAVVRERGFRLVALTPGAGAVPIDRLGVGGTDEGTGDGTDDRTDARV